MTLKERIFEEYQHGSGGSLQEIAEKVGCSKSYVKSITEGGARSHLNEADKMQIAFLWGADHCLTSIGHEMRVGPLRIERLLRKNGLIS